jgi:hypothetical protein
VQQRCPDQPCHCYDHADADQTQKQRTRHPRLWISATEPFRSISHADNLFGASRAHRAGSRVARSVRDAGVSENRAPAVLSLTGRSERCGSSGRGVLPLRATTK